MEEHAALPAFRIDPALEKGQCERLRQVRASRVADKVAAELNALEAAARGTDNVMPHIVASCEAFATVGEISDRLRNVFGEYREGG